MDDVTQAVSIEIKSILKDGWGLTNQGGVLIVAGPCTPDFVSEVWRISRFVAYDAYVCIERMNGLGTEYKVTSRSRQGLAFELRIRAIE